MPKVKSSTSKSSRKRSFSRGDKVIWWSPVSGDESVAVFVEYDHDFPNEDGILVVKIGGTYVHKFRWPLRYMKKGSLEELKEVRRRESVARRRSR